MGNENNILGVKLADILEIARFAPSVHNTQPWIVGCDGNYLEVKIDPRHRLTYGDPTGRQTIISLGIFCEAIKIAAENLGLECLSAELQQGSAQIKFAQNTGKQDNNKAVDLLRSRSTDRSIFKATAISDSTIRAIESVSLSTKVRIKVVTDQKILKQIAELTSKGIGLALSNPNFRKELGEYLLEPWSKKRRGIAVSSLYITWPLAILEPLLMKLGIGIKAESNIERKRWLSASAVVVIMADGDLADYWFEAGRVYLRASLAIEDTSLSQATSAAIVEASNYHDDIEELLGTNQRILGLIRIGKGRPHRYSPRLEASDLIAKTT